VGRFEYRWSVNASAQAAGIAGLSDCEQVEKGREVLRAGKEHLVNEGCSLVLVLEFSPQVGANGVKLAHSGTVVGMLFPDDAVLA
jgi:histidinol-phosphate/aromatic aminotransferase/cobyric acid decarboxylase-like protein